MGFNKKFFTTGGIVASAPPAAAGLDPLQNFETVTYTGNGGTQKITGYIRKGAAFNGSSSQIDIPHNTEFDATGGLSVSFWINRDNTNSFFPIDKANGGSGSYGWQFIFNSSTGYRFQVHNTSNGAVSADSGTGYAATGTWEHVVGTISSSGVAKIYVDGVLKNTTSALGGTISSNTGGVTIGSYFNNTNWLSGKLDQIRFFNTDIDQTAVDALYAEVYASSTKSTTDIFGDGSGVALYELDDSANDTGGTYNGTATNVNFLGMAFQPDLVWIKLRNTASDHDLIDSVRGATKVIESNQAYAEFTEATNLTSFDSNGFTVGSTVRVNKLNEPIVAWCWKAADTTTNISASGSQVAAEVRANTAAGFSIVKYTFSSPSASQTVPHGLDSAPEMIITKSTTDTGNWYTYHKDVGTGKYLILNGSAAAATYANGFSTVDATAWQQYFRSDAQSHVAYCFHSVDEYQKVGSYSGGTTNKIVETGFEPRFLLIKAASGTHSTEHWVIYDYQRSPTNPRNDWLYPNLNFAENVNVTANINFLSNGFELAVTSANTGINGASTTYIYLAIA